MSAEGLPPGLAAIAAGIDQAHAPRLTVELAPPPLEPIRAGNLLPGVWSFEGASAGPHVAIVAAVHGNEIAGAVLLDRWLRTALRPLRGRLSLVFANLDALARFDPGDPTASRFVDEDLNRVWDPETLDGGRRSCELRRARALRPFLDDVDLLLDLHSMLWPSEPLLLAGGVPRAAQLGLAMGVPPLVVADEGHSSGRRLIDYAPFSDLAGARTALLAEAGGHWEATTVDVMEATAFALLRHAGLCTPRPPIPSGPTRLAAVTRTVTARTGSFAFVEPFRGGQVVPRRNTLIALDGTEEVRTPHDDCLLVMPSLRTMPGQTAVRLARFVA